MDWTVMVIDLDSLRNTHLTNRDRGIGGVELWDLTRSFHERSEFPREV